MRQIEKAVALKKVAKTKKKRRTQKKLVFEQHRRLRYND